MRFYLLSPQCPPNPHLFPMFIDTWKSEGIEIRDRIEDCDVVLMDLHSRLFDYKQEDVDWVVNNSVYIATFDEWDRGGLSNEIYPIPLTWQQQNIWTSIHGNNPTPIHFCRLLDKTDHHVSNLYPYEKPILYEEPLLSPEQLFDRPYDIVWIANTAPQREMLKEVLENDGRLKTKIILGAEKIPLQEWINAHKQGKMFVKWGGGGYGCEKAQHLFSVAAMIKEDNDQLLLHDWTHTVNCIKINPIPTAENLQILVDVVNNKEKLYKLYENNYYFMREFYSAGYIAKDILNKIKKHLND